MFFTDGRADEAAHCVSAVNIFCVARARRTRFRQIAILRFSSLPLLMRCKTFIERIELRDFRFGIGRDSKSQTINPKSRITSIAFRETNPDNLSDLDLCTRRRTLPANAPVATRFNLQTELGADTRRISHTLPFKVWHQ